MIAGQEIDLSSPERADRAAQVQAQVNYHRQRLLRYRDLHGSRPTPRLQELEHAYLSATNRLARHTAGNETPADGKARPA
jgi:hypothetical protein